MPAGLIDAHTGESSRLVSYANCPSRFDPPTADDAEEHVTATALTALGRVAGTGELIDTVHTALEPRSHGAVSE